MIDLFEEEILKPKKKKKMKSTTLILIIIVLLLILLIITMVSIVYLRGTILTITLDGNDAKSLQQIFIFEENNKVYMPIKRMAEYLQYDAFNGDYITKSEDQTKCYIQTQEELVSFTLNSNVLTKVVDGQSQQIKIVEPIKEINGELCITSDGAQQAFNFKFYYDVENKNINIQTLQFLYSWYSNQAIKQGYLPIEQEVFANKTAILDDMLIVKGQNNAFGVIRTNGETILETKYDSIEYLRKTSDFLVGSNNKKGIISVDRSTKVELIYDSIQRVTNKNDTFYVVGLSNQYGLLDVNGRTIIYPEYEQIGIDVNAYAQNGVTNGYVLYSRLVPVKRNGKWALFDIEGKHITNFVYDSFGCPVGKSDINRTYGVIEVYDYNLIVACKEGKYNLITLEGKELFDRAILDYVYITISEGKQIYYITSGEITKELISFLQENGITKPTPIER